MRRAVAFLGIVFGTFIGLAGLFLVLYQGDSTSEADVYVTILGAEIDADLAGAAMIVLALAATGVSIRALSRAGVP